MHRGAMFFGVVVASLLIPTASQAAARPSRPDLVVTSVHPSVAGSSLTATVKIANTGTAKARTSVLRLSLSGGVTLGTARVPALGAHRSKVITVHVGIPAGTHGGRYAVVACADATRKVKERNERNNCRGSATVTIVGPVVQHPTPSPTPSPTPTPTPSPTGSPQTYAGPGPAVIADATTDAPFLQPFDPPSPREAGEAAGVTSQNLTYDETRTTTRTIAAATGGSLSLTDAAGDQMTLHVPAGALLKDTVISATPIAGSSLDGTAIGARFEPAGLVLLQAATFDIVPSAARGGLPQAVAPITSNDDGTGTELATVLPDNSKIELLVEHFTEVQIQVDYGSGVTAMVDPATYTDWMGGRIRAVLAQARDQEVQTGQPADMTQYQQLFEQEYADEIVPIVNASQTDCGVARSDFRYALAWAHAASQMGQDADKVQAVQSGLGGALANCWRQDIAGCMTMDRLPQALADAHALALLGTDVSTQDFTWCDPVNGVIKVTHAVDDTNSLQFDVQDDQTRITELFWVSGTATINGPALSINASGLSLDYSGTTSYDEEWSSGSGECVRRLYSTAVRTGVPFAGFVKASFSGPGTGPSAGPYLTPVGNQDIHVGTGGSNSCDPGGTVPDFGHFPIESDAVGSPYALTLSPTGDISGHADVTNTYTDESYHDTVDVDIHVNGYPPPL